MTRVHLAHVTYVIDASTAACAAFWAVYRATYGKKVTLHGTFAGPHVLVYSM